MNNTPSNKNSMRKFVFSQRENLTYEMQQQLSQNICHHLISLTPIQQAQTIALYRPYKNEADITHLIDLTSHPILFALPRILSNKHLEFHSYKKGDALITNKFGIQEPNNDQPTIDPKNIDVIILPAVAFDADCNRVGTGAGYYDRTLEFLRKKISAKPYLIATAYEFQKVEKISPDFWDIPLNCVVTENKIYYQNPNDFR